MWLRAGGQECPRSELASLLPTRASSVTVAHLGATRANTAESVGENAGGATADHAETVAAVTDRHPSGQPSHAA